jgi:hypothetical protein
MLVASFSFDPPRSPAPPARARAAARVGSPFGRNVRRDSQEPDPSGRAGGGSPLPDIHVQRPAEGGGGRGAVLRVHTEGVLGARGAGRTTEEGQARVRGVRDTQLPDALPFDRGDEGHARGDERRGERRRSRSRIRPTQGRPLHRAAERVESAPDRDIRRDDEGGDREGEDRGGMPRGSGRWGGGRGEEGGRGGDREVEADRGEGIARKVPRQREAHGVQHEISKADERTQGKTMKKRRI